MRTRRNIYLMYAIALLQGMVFYGPIATLYREAAGITIFQITLIESISMALGLLLELPWGAVADRIGYRRTMIVCCMLYLASKLVFWRAEGFGMFLLERVLLAVVCAGLSGVEEAVLYLSADEGQSQRCFGIWNSLGQAGLMVAALVYSVFVGENYRLAGLLTVFSYGLAAQLSLSLVEVRPAEKRAATHPVRDFGSALRGLMRTPGLLLLVLSMALLSETHQTITVFLAQKQYEACGMAGAAFGGAYLLLTLAGLAGGLSQRCTRRLGEVRFGALCCLTAAVCCVTLALTRQQVEQHQRQVHLKQRCCGGGLHQPPLGQRRAEHDEREVRGGPGEGHGDQPRGGNAVGIFHLRAAAEREQLNFGDLHARKPRRQQMRKLVGAQGDGHGG